MVERTYTKTFIKEWREYRGLSLRQLAQRLEVEGAQETYSHASIGRVENGKQPYSQPLIEAIARALDVSVANLLEVDPYKEGEVVDLVRMIKDRDKDAAIRMLKGLASGTGTNG